MTDQVRPARLLQRCGTCDHNHRAGLGCALCGCVRFRMHPADVAAEDQVAAAERAERDGRDTLLGAGFAGRLMEAIDSWEQSTFRGWDEMPLLCRVVAGRLAEVDQNVHPDVDDNLAVVVIKVEPLRVPPWFYARCAERSGGDNFVAGLVTLANAFERRASHTDAMLKLMNIDPDLPAIAWMWVSEAYAKDAADATRSAAADPSLRRDEMRTVVAVDVDERQYHVQRLRFGRIEGLPMRSVTGPTSPRKFRAEVREHAAAVLPDVPFEELCGPEGMPRVNRQLVRLVRCSTARVETRAMFAGFGDPDR